MHPGVAIALQVPTEYLDAVSCGVPVVTSDALKFCPQCWVPGTALEKFWLSPRSQFCFLCGTGLRDSCVNCGEPVMSLKFRFCPYCGCAYKESKGDKALSQS